jgi:sirohydrochlorin cobaltochelatase
VQPDVASGLNQLVLRGVQRVVVAPLLLFAAGHAKQDIPQAATTVAARLRVPLLLAPPLGCHPLLLELSADRFREVASRVGVEPRAVHWLFVGRGSRSGGAEAEFHEFLTCRRRLIPVGASHAAFLALGQPHIQQVALQVARSPLNWVVVQPHLLFAGELLDRLERIVNEEDQAHERQRWLLAEHLGTDRRVALAVADRFRQAVTAGGGAG